MLTLGMGCSNPVAMQHPEGAKDPPTVVPVQFIEGSTFETSCIIAPENPSLRPYVEMLRGNDDLTSAIGFCDLPQLVRGMMWAKLAEAEATGNSPTVSFSHPQNDTGSAGINYDEQEAFEIVAARLAHALWVDHHELVPWRLSDYGQAELAAILDPNVAFMVWDTRRSYYHDAAVTDHDPAAAYHLALEALDGQGNDQESAITALVDSTRTFRHGLVGRDEVSIRTLEEMHAERVSMYGCTSMVYYLVALARAINIPARPLQGYYQADNHTSAIFEVPGLVLAHGDDIYDALLRSTPSGELLDSLEFWQENILIYPPEDERVRIPTQQHHHANAMRYPSEFLTHWYCSRGRPYLDTIFSEFADSEQIDELEERLIMMTENCSR